MTKNTLDAYAEWRGMPEYTNVDQTSFRKIVVHFRNAEDVQRFAELVGQKLGQKLKSIWFPEAEIGRYAHLAYIDAPDA